VRKHANAMHVSVSIENRVMDGAETVLMQVKDDGVGFAARDSKRRFGLQTMGERARSVQGTLMVRSVPGEGTIIECSLPCLPRQQRNQWLSRQTGPAD
jgi:signal transduction histidine kinase